MADEHMMPLEGEERESEAIAELGEVPPPPGAGRGRSGWRDLGEATVMLIVAFLASALLIVLIGQNPISAFRAVATTAFGSKKRVGETLESSTPLIFAGLAFAIAFRARLLNLGVGSQVLMGALAAAWLGYAFELPSVIHIPLLMIGGAITGGAYAAIAGSLKAYRGVHEVISTIMLEYVALSIINFMVNGPMQDPREASLPQTAQIFKSAWLPRVLPPSRLSAGIFIVMIVGVVVWWIRDRSRIGFEWAATGAGPKAAELAGMSPKRSIMTAMMTSGAVAGLAGAVLMSGNYHRYQSNTSAGLGLVGLAVALLSRQRILGLFIAGLLFGSLAQGQRGMAAIGVPQDMQAVIQGFIVFFVSAPQIIWVLESRWKKRRQTEMLAPESSPS